jgi:hypothetical protein
LRNFHEIDQIVDKVIVVVALENETAVREKSELVESTMRCDDDDGFFLFSDGFDEVTNDISRESFVRLLGVD